jgi:hypothetical protein
MRRNKLALFLHLVWATWDRLPLITPDIERRLYRNIESEARNRVAPFSRSTVRRTMYTCW